MEMQVAGLRSFPTRAEAVLPDLLERFATATPDRTFAVFESGTQWDFAETARRSWQFAGALLKSYPSGERGVVTSLLPNGGEALISWFGTASAGWAYSPLNTAYRGVLLEEALNLTMSKVLVCHADLVSRLTDLNLPHLELVVVVGGPAEGRGSAQNLRQWEEFVGTGPVSRPTLSPPVEPWDDLTVLLTSGTTGVSKAVRRTAVQYSLYCDIDFRYPGVTADDRFYVCGPMFHGGADVPIYSMLQLGGSIAISERFSTSRFWHDVRRFRCTTTWIHSAMSLFLHKQPKKDDDGDNPLRLAMLAPLFPGWEEFAQRFDIQVMMVYGMTEIPTPFCVVDPTAASSLGLPVDQGAELRIVDENDLEVADGTPGELILRHRWPWAISPGYFGNEEATAKVWRNGWFHTGDVFTRDDAGNYFLVDRLKDSIRRRGENIASAEVEREVLIHPQVLDVAVIGVPADMEEDVLAFVVRTEGSELSAEALHTFLVDRLPYFALPRYIAFVADLPRSASLRIDKPRLRRAGVPADAWDRDAAGVRVQREEFSGDRSH